MKTLVGFSGRAHTAQRPTHINGQNGVPKQYRVTSGREVVSTPSTEIIKNRGPLRKHVLIGELTLGIIRYEWHIHRSSQIIPINFQCGTVMASHAPPTHAAMNYSTPDAQNVVLERAILDKYEWLMYWEDDVLPPFDALLKMNVHMEKMTAPILSGLYFTKGNPSWPLVFRGRGNGAWFKGWQVGDKIWVDGVPTGFILIHRSIFEWLWKNSPEYRLPDGRLLRRAFEFPRKTWFDPEQDRYFTEMGTSDLTMCDRIIKNDVLRKTGWTKLAKQKYPFLVDTSIFCGHIDLQSGQVYPQSAREVLWPKR